MMQREHMGSETAIIGDGSVAITPACGAPFHSARCMQEARCQVVNDRKQVAIVLSGPEGSERELLLLLRPQGRRLRPGGRRHRHVRSPPIPFRRSATWRVIRLALITRMIPKDDDSSEAALADDFPFFSKARDSHAWSITQLP